MEIAEHVAALRREGDVLAAAAQRTPLDAVVPTCPGWSVRDLVRHIGGIHRWATGHVSLTRTDRYDPFVELEGHWPPDALLVDWFREGHAGLVTALETAPADLACFTFLPAPSPLAFWARRQAHETGMHRADVEGASGSVTPYPPEVAADGIDELLFGFVSRKGGRLVGDSSYALGFHADDVARDWLVRVGQAAPQVSHASAHADLLVSGSASDLFLLLWNRRGLDALQVAGDSALLEKWRERVQVRWS